LHFAEFLEIPILQVIELKLFKEEISDIMADRKRAGKWKGIYSPTKK